jgi:hypothetical protein
VSTLHITNGDCAADTLRTFLADPVIITADPLFEGPAPEVDDDRWYALRGRKLAGEDGGERDIAAELAASDRRVAEAARCGSDIVLWFEHDLFDQLLLIRTLDRIRADARSLNATGGTWLVCIDRFPGVERFIGLGQLTAEQLATLVEHKLPVTDQQFDYAARAWAAFRADHPSALTSLIGPGPLPFSVRLFGGCSKNILRPSTDFRARRCRRCKCSTTVRLMPVHCLSRRNNSKSIRSSATGAFTTCFARSPVRQFLS